MGPQFTFGLLTSLILFSLVFYSHSWAAHPGEKTSSFSRDQPSIRIRVEQDSHFEVRGLDLKFFRTSKLGDPLSKILDTKERSVWQITCKKGEIVLDWREKKWNFRMTRPMSIQTPAGFLALNGRPYRSELRVFPAEKGGCSVVNVVDIEKYLDGLVNAEFSASWDADAIAAQVIAARTYAYYQISEAKKSGRYYDVESTVKDQVYDGPKKEDYRASQSVDRTSGLVLMAEKKGKSVPLKAFYHSTCGGKTELPQNVWGKNYVGFKKRVRCPYCKKSPRYGWKYDLTLEKLRSAILNGAEEEGAPKNWPRVWKPLVKTGSLEKFNIIKRANSRRASEIKMLWKLGESESPIYRELSMSASRFRSWMGSMRIRSTAFQARTIKRGDQVVSYQFYGKGYGHGVGMCQWGAKVMGEKGYNMAKILKHYYPQAFLKRLW